MGASPSGENGLVGRTLRDGICIREKLTESSVGTLYRAEYPSGLGVVVLVLSPSTDSKTLALVRQRFRRAIEIQHPNVASVQAVAETHDGLTYVVADCLDGEPLSAALARRPVLSPREALDIVLQAAAGLQAAHDVRWVHGNLSPDTIVLSKTAGGYPIVKLIGFTQEFLLPGEPRPSDLTVRPEYASPERLAGQRPDAQSDVFSLGAVLYRLLTGEPPTPPARYEGVSESLRATLDRALAPSPSTRFQTVAEFAAAIAALQDAPAGSPRSARIKARRAVELRYSSALVLVAAVVWLLGPRQPADVAPTPAGLRESGSVPAIAQSGQPAVPPGREPLIRHDSAGARIGPTRQPRRSDSGATLATDSGPKISPFLRAHPWAAMPGKRFYYLSACPIALQSHDLLYFKSEAEARAAGFVPNDVPGCH